jgi:FkbM family methyltransferase
MRIRRILKNLIIKHGGVYPSPLTEHTDLLALISSLRPVITEHKLVRFGPDGDGGYLLPNDLDGIKACYSPGVGEISLFEKQCAELGMNVYLADASVNGPAQAHPRFFFEKKFIGATSNNHFMTLNDWVISTEPNGELILQMDIEGFEYDVLLNTTDELIQRFRIIVVEFHYLKGLWCKHFFTLANRVFNKIVQTHKCVHIHPNNNSGIAKFKGIAIPGAMEFTFLRNDRIQDYSFASTFPHPLDHDTTDNPTMVLPKCWH